MPPEEITREILWNVPGWAKALMYALFVVSAIVCVRGFLLRFKAWRQGLVAPAKAPSSAASAVRAAFRRLTREALLHVSIWRSTLAGASHAMIFWGFVALFIGTCIVAVEEYGGMLFSAEPFWFFGTFYLVVSCALEVAGFLFLAGLVIALLRRKFDPRFRPLSRRIDHLVILLFLAIGLSGFVIEGLRIAATVDMAGVAGESFERWSFLGWWLATAFDGIDSGILCWLHLSMWIVHMMLTMLFIAALPYCKLRHILLAPLQLALVDPRPSGKLAAISLEEFEATERYGVNHPADLSWKQFLSYDACTECGRCQTVCPAYATGKPLSPMRVVWDLASSAGSDRKLPGDLISTEAIWACTSCGACVHECPVAIDQLGAIIDLRRGLVGEGEIRGSEQKALRSLGTSGNPWGLPAGERMDWAEGLEVPTTEDEDAPEVIYWVGCAASFDRRSQSVARAMVKIFRAAGVRFAVLGKKERCTGDPARRLGDEFTFMELAEQNVAALLSAGTRTVVASCAHCFNTLKNEYPDYGCSLDVLHHSRYIARLIEDGRLPDISRSSKVPAPKSSDSQGLGPDGRVIAIHDACYVGRHNGETAAPRSLIEASGAEVKEPALSGESGFCCGAGGGRMWMEEHGERINEERFRQLEETSPDAIAVSCPFCMTMLSDAAAAKDSPIEVLDVAELIASRLDQVRDQGPTSPS